MTSQRIWKSFLAIASLAMILAGGLVSPLAQTASREDEIVIVGLGDSLMAGYQLPPDAAFPVRLEKALKARGHNVRVVNAGVSGDTSADGLARFDWAMPKDADAVILELGANDALRGIPVAETKKALNRILAKIGERGLPVLIAGMEAPRNWGEEYVGEFRAMYKSLAGESGALLYPFFLDGIALNPDLNLGDGLHPNEKGVDVIVERILPAMEKLIARVKEKRGT